MGLLQQKNEQPLNLVSVKIESDKLMLVSVSRVFAQNIFREFTADITRYMVPKPVDHIDEIYAFIDVSRKRMIDEDQLVMAIIETESGQFSGICAIHGKEQGVAAELGIWIKKRAQGKRLGREAIRLLVTWAQDNLIVSCLTYPVDKDNVPSRKIAESLGGIVIEEGRRESHSGNILNEVLYKLDLA